MSRKSVPSYRLHRQSGQAIVTIADPRTRQRRDLLLGRHNSAESRAEDARLLMEGKSIDGRLPARSRHANPANMTVNELMSAYVRHVSKYYLKEGQPTSEQEAI